MRKITVLIGMISLIVMVSGMLGVSEKLTVCASATATATTATDVANSDYSSETEDAQIRGQVAEKGLLKMVSKGDYVGSGQKYHLDQGIFGAELGLDGKGKVDTIIVRYYPFGTEVAQWEVDISSHMLEKPLQKQDYANAVRYPFEGKGEAGLSVIGESRGCNEVRGSFTIEKLKINYSGSTPKLKKLVVSFRQFCEGAKPGLKGTLYFNTLPDKVDRLRMEE